VDLGRPFRDRFDPEGLTCGRWRDGQEGRVMADGKVRGGSTVRTSAPEGHDHPVPDTRDPAVVRLGHAASIDVTMRDGVCPGLVEVPVLRSRGPPWRMSHRRNARHPGLTRRRASQITTQIQGGSRRPERCDRRRRHRHRRIQCDSQQDLPLARQHSPSSPRRPLAPSQRAPPITAKLQEPTERERLRGFTSTSHHPRSSSQRACRRSTSTSI
jgi:hypothetical protein